MKGKAAGQIYGFPMVRGAWCNDRLKMAAIREAKKAVVQSMSNGDDHQSQGADKNTVISYLGIAVDEPERLARLDNITAISPLSEIGWTEADCWKWCEENDLLSPIYNTATRGGCWFCHNQGVDQLRLLRRNYPDLWQILLQWDIDSPVSFKPGGRTVRDFDKRFAMEDLGLISTDQKFRWKMINQYVQEAC